MIQTLLTSRCLQWRIVQFCNMLFDIMVRHVTENCHLKCPVHFFCWNIFHLLSYEQKKINQY